MLLTQVLNTYLFHKGYPPFPLLFLVWFIIIPSSLICVTVTTLLLLLYAIFLIKKFALQHTWFTVSYPYLTHTSGNTYLPDHFFFIIIHLSIQPFMPSTTIIISSFTKLAWLCLGTWMKGQVILQLFGNCAFPIATCIHVCTYSKYTYLYVYLSI